ncbi:MAG: radical SAM protein [Nitrospinae bacterium]|nr:radical SAM protein [Nitrospinota bacterium]
MQNAGREFSIFNFQFPISNARRAASLASARDFLNATRQKFLQLIQERRSLFATFQVTAGCNLRCKNCGGDFTEPRPDELATEEVYALIRNLQRAGTTYLSLGGGEPTMRDDLPQIVAYASSLMGVGMVSNGVLLDEEYAELLKRAGLSVVDISLDGASAETHDPQRGAGSFERGLRALQNCQRAGIPVVDLQTTISQLNYPELPRIIRLALDLGVNIVVNQFIPCGRAQGRDDLLLTREQRKELQRYLIEQERLFGKQRIKFDRYYIVSEDEKGQRIWGDPAKSGFNVGDPFGIYGYAIAANGKVTPTTPEIEIGDLRREELSEVWTHSDVLATLRNRERLKGKCGRCEYKFICGGDRRRTHALTGDPMGEDPLCWYEPFLETMSYEP